MKSSEPPLKTDLELDLPDWSDAKPLRQPARPETLERLRKAHHSRRQLSREHQLARLRTKQDAEFVI